MMPPPRNLFGACVAVGKSCMVCDIMVESPNKDFLHSNLIWFMDGEIIHSMLKKYAVA